MVLQAEYLKMKLVVPGARIELAAPAFSGGALPLSYPDLPNRNQNATAAITASTVMVAGALGYSN
jgi:hypothetical protein